MREIVAHVTNLSFIFNLQKNKSVLFFSLDPYNTTMGDFNIDAFDSPFTMDSPFAPADEGSTPRGATSTTNNAAQGQQQTQQTAQHSNTAQAQQHGDQQQYDYSQYYYGGQTDASGQVDYQSYYYQGQTENGGYYYDPNQQYDYSQYYYGQEYAYGEEQAQQGYDAFQQIQQEVEAAQQQLQNTGLNNNATQQAQPAQQHTPAATSVTPQYQQPVQPVVPAEDPKIKLFARVSTQNEEEYKDEFPRVGIVDFYEKDSDANIRYDDPGQRIIASSTLPKLIEKLTSSQAGKKLNFPTPNQNLLFRYGLVTLFTFFWMTVRNLNILIFTN